MVGFFLGGTREGPKGQDGWGSGGEGAGGGGGGREREPGSKVLPGIGANFLQRVTAPRLRAHPRRARSCHGSKAR